MSKFLPGQSGNPNGRPKGKTAATLIRQEIVLHAPEILKTLFAQTKAGDVQACKVLLDRICPPLKPQTEAVTIDIASNDTLATIGQYVIDSIARGDISSDIGGQLLSNLGTQAKLIETTDLIQRIEALEAARK
ncbi:DUF5681 domain-containing protein [Methylocucumis oryzae]|uniref:DUF5681 domain-containing protein n=1 Tax=Methylocucumis oryzae TaxID=1632867 RepID=A0A0F3IK24_9GAMM|nr:DUF5681 domain-containing protein [Methylocucumis oryzae]KJV05919.1 hypothetical protein VZ94_14675 [Methylocucumis oryzae]